MIHGGTICSHRMKISAEYLEEFPDSESVKAVCSVAFPWRGNRNFKSYDLKLSWELGIFLDDVRELLLIWSGMITVL